MRNIIWFFLFCSAHLYGQTQDVRVFHEKQTSGYMLYAANPEYFPVSVSLDLNLTNLEFSEPVLRIFVVPARTERFKLGELKVSIPSQRYTFGFKYRYTTGDVTIREPDKNIVYDLPFKKDGRFRLVQGYHGVFSHQDENALDFTMPEGTDVLAAREGTVVKVVQNNTEHCPSMECEKYNNYVMVMHRDGTYANYVHIQYNSSGLKPGDMVNKGDVLAKSGNVGFTSGPHLHFVCFTGGFDKWHTLETTFRTDKGDDAVMLQEGNYYTRNY